MECRYLQVQCCSSVKASQWLSRDMCIALLSGHGLASRVLLISCEHSSSPWEGTPTVTTSTSIMKGVRER